jgi:hypothetical protein
MAAFELRIAIVDQEPVPVRAEVECRVHELAFVGDDAGALDLIALDRTETFRHTSPQFHGRAIFVVTQDRLDLELVRLRIADELLKIDSFVLGDDLHLAEAGFRIKIGEGLIVTHTDIL